MLREVAFRRDDAEDDGPARDRLPLCRDDGEDQGVAGRWLQLRLRRDDAENDERVGQGSRRTRKT